MCAVCVQMCPDSMTWHLPPSGDRSKHSSGVHKSHDSQVRRAKSACDVRRRSAQLQRAKHLLDAGKLNGVRVSLVMTSAPNADATSAHLSAPAAPLTCSGSSVLRRSDVTQRVDGDDVRKSVSRRPMSASDVVERQLRRSRDLSKRSSRVQVFHVTQLRDKCRFIG